MWEVDNERISKEEVRDINQNLRNPESIIDDIMESKKEILKSVNQEASLGARQEIRDLKKRYNYKLEMKALSEFMVRNFCVGLLIKYGTLFEQTEETVHGISLQQLSSMNSSDGRMANIQSRTIGQAELSKFVQVLIGRVKATRQQFKQMCIMCIKFMSICDKASTNYMKYLKHDARKVITSSLFLTFPDRKRESVIPLFSKATGLSDQQIRYCSDIVGPILKSEYLKQRRTLFRQTHSTIPCDELTTNSLFLHHNEPLQSTSNLDDNNPAALNTVLSANFPTTVSNLRSAQTSSSSSSSSIHNCRSVDIRSTNFGAFTDYYGNIEDLDDSDSYLLPIELEQFNEMGKLLVHRNFRVI